MPESPQSAQQECALERSHLPLQPGKRKPPPTGLLSNGGTKHHAYERCHNICDKCNSPLATPHACVLLWSRQGTEQQEEEDRKQRQEQCHQVPLKANTNTHDATEQETYTCSAFRYTCHDHGCEC